MPDGKLRPRDILSTAALVAGGVALVVAIQGVGTNANKTARDTAATEVKRQLLADNYKHSIDDWHRLQLGCKRSKRDRAVIVTVHEALERYYEGVIHAQSVKPDVKNIATDVRNKLIAATRSLMSRTGRHLNCRVVYPKPVAPPGVKALP